MDNPLSYIHPQGLYELHQADGHVRLDFSDEAKDLIRFYAVDGEESELDTVDDLTALGKMLAETIGVASDYRDYLRERATNPKGDLDEEVPF